MRYNLLIVGEDSNTFYYMATKTTKKTKAETTTKVEKKPKATKAAKVVADVAIPSEDKKSVIEEFATKKGDTGSPEVQIALLTKRIEKLVAHLKANPGDNHSRRGLLGMVSKRRRLINYLTKKDESRVKDIMGKLQLGK